MAEPTKNLIDATGLFASPPKAINKYSVTIFNNLGICLRPINTTSTNNRWDIVTIANINANKIFKPLTVLRQDKARSANIVTFPAVYKERGAASISTSQSRPSEGQLWPRGVCGNSITITDASVSYNFSASTEWLQTHSFGHNPIVEVVDSNGAEVWADVTFPTITQVRVQFSEPIAGTLTLS